MIGTRCFQRSMRSEWITIGALGNASQTSPAFGRPLKSPVAESLVSFRTSDIQPNSGGKNSLVLKPFEMWHDFTGGIL